MRKLILILLGLFSFVSTMNAQWQGTNPLWTNANIGIGTSNPLVKLNVCSLTYGLPVTSGIAQPSGILRLRGADNGILDFGESDDHLGTFWLQATDVTSLAQTYKLLLNPNGGNVGIGLVNPAYNLEIAGRTKAKSFSVLSAVSDLVDDNPWYGLGALSNNVVQLAGYYGLLLRTGGAKLELNGNGNIFLNGGNVGIGTTTPTSKLHIDTYNAGDAITLGATYQTGTKYAIGINTNTAFIIRDASSGVDRFAISQSGNIGIGTSTPTTKLAVNGTIRCQEVLVEASPWPDNVFAKDYKLKSITEVDTYIKANNHLPNMPAASEVEQNGVKLSELNTKLLQKVEELTLYLIEQNKQIEELKKENKQIKELIKQNK